jgi:mannosyltransferase OCH1-like enzyme
MVIHYCQYGNHEFSPIGESCYSSWRSVLKNYELRLWNESSGLGGSPYVQSAFKARKYAFVADYMRCAALYTHGGIYLDTDIEVLRPFDPLLDQQMFLGYEAPGLVGTAIIGAVPGHPLLKRIMDRLDDEARSGRISYRPGPELITEELANFGPDLVTLYPEEYFYPYNPHTSVPKRKKPLISNMTENTYCVHQWEGSWVSEASLSMLIGVRISHVLRNARKSIGLAPRNSPSSR